MRSPVGEAMKTRSIDDLAALGEDTFQSGTSEIKNWVPVAGAMAELGFDLNLVDPDQIEGIEVYSSGAQMPPRFNRTSSGCGAVVIWMRVGS